jgi:hypothetical protein
VRPGFRAITAEKQWRDYVRDTSAEIALIKQDFIRTQGSLLSGGWIATADETPFQMFLFGDPWVATTS